MSHCLKKLVFFLDPKAPYEENAGWRLSEEEVGMVVDTGGLEEGEVVLSLQGDVVAVVLGGEELGPVSQGCSCVETLQPLGTVIMAIDATSVMLFVCLPVL